MKQPKALNSLRLVLAATLFAMLAYTANAARADDALSKQRVIYEVYAGGIHAVQGVLDVEIKPKNRYSLMLSAKTRGFLGRLAPWNGTFETHGWRGTDGDYRPEQHKSVATWRGEEETKDYAYTKTGGFKSITINEHDKPPHKPDIERDITQDTIDALTAALLVMNDYNETGECAGSSKVFDGKRSFLQNFMHEKTVDLKSSKYNIYEGPAAECTVEVTPLKGKWHSKPRGWLSIQEQGRDKGLMPTLWMASIDPDAPALPVKIRVKTDYGTLFMHMAEYQNGDEVITAEKRVTDDE